MRIVANTGTINSTIATPKAALAINTQIAGISIPPPTVNSGTSGTPHSIAGRVQPLNTGSESVSTISSVFALGRRNQHASNDRCTPNEKATDENMRNIAKPGVLEHHLEASPDDGNRTHHPAYTEQRVLDSDQQGIDLTELRRCRGGCHDKHAEHCDAAPIQRDPRNTRFSQSHVAYIN
jgi:hypothetical protein